MNELGQPIPRVVPKTLTFNAELPVCFHPVHRAHRPGRASGIEGLFPYSTARLSGALPSFAGTMER